MVQFEQFNLKKKHRLAMLFKPEFHDTVELRKLKISIAKRCFFPNSKGEYKGFNAAKKSRTSKGTSKTPY